MNTGKLISYLDSLITLEKEIDSLENIIAGLENEINKTYPFDEKKPIHPKEPVVPLNPENAKKRLEQEKQTNFISTSIFFVIVFGVVSAIVCGGAIGIGIIIAKVAKTNGTIVMPISALCGGIFSLVIALWIVIKPEKMRKKEITEKQKRLDVNYVTALKKYENDKREYSVQREQYNYQLNLYNQKLQKFNQQQEIYKSNLQIKLNNIKEKLENAYSLIRAYYGLNIIPSKYQSFVPVCMFYEYLVNKRTYGLYRNPNGNDPGAINMYEEEKNQKIIQTQLSDLKRTIRNGVSSVLESQRHLRYAIEDSNEKSQAVLSSICDEINNTNNGLRQTNSRLNSINSNITYNNYLNEVIIEQNRYRNKLAEWQYYG